MSLFSEIRSQLGETIADWLQTEFPGKTILIPKSIECWTGDLGEAGNRLCSEFGGLWIYIPIGIEACRQRRNNEIKEAWKQGRSVPEIALEHQVTERHVYRVLASLR